MKITEKIRFLRECHEYSQEYVSIQLGISQSTYSKIENNVIKIHLEMLTKIARLYGINVISILNDNDLIIFRSGSSNDNNINEKKTIIGINQLEQRLVFLERNYYKLAEIIRRHYPKRCVN